MAHQVQGRAAVGLPAGGTVRRPAASASPQLPLPVLGICQMTAPEPNQVEVQAPHHPAQGQPPQRHSPGESRR